MDFTISSGVLYKHLSNVNRTIPTKSSLPILENFLFTVERGSLRIMASDLETTMLVTLPLDSVRREGAIAVPARLLLETLKEFPEMPLNFSADLDTQRVQVDYNTGDRVGEFSLTGADASQFPEMPALLPERTVEIRTTTDVLLSGISHTIGTASTDSKAAHMYGILMLAKEDGLRFVTTDSNRLSHYLRTDVSCTGENRVFLPLRPATLLNSLLNHGAEDLTMSFDDRNLQFETSLYRVVCHLTEVRFPDYEQVIPRQHPFELVVDRELFYQALRQVSPFSNKGRSSVSLDLTASELTVSTHNADNQSEAYQKLPCRYTGEEISVCYNSPYLTDALAVMSSQEVKITLSPTAPNSLVCPTINESESEDMFVVLVQDRR